MDQPCQEVAGRFFCGQEDRRSPGDDAAARARASSHQKPRICNSTGPRRSPSRRSCVPPAKLEKAGATCVSAVGAPTPCGSRRKAAPGRRRRADNSELERGSQRIFCGGSGNFCARSGNLFRCSSAFDAPRRPDPDSAPLFAVRPTAQSGLSDAPDRSRPGEGRGAWREPQAPPIRCSRWTAAATNGHALFNPARNASNSASAIDTRCFSSG